MEYIFSESFTSKDIENLERICFNHGIYSEEQIEDMLGNKELYEFLVIGNNLGEKIGYLIIFDNSDSLEIMKIGVLPEYRKKGIGKILLNKLFEKNRNILLEVREKNSVARNFYESNGFLVIGKRKNYYPDDGDTAILMMKEMEN